MSPQELEHALLNLPSVGRLIKDRRSRQVWRFDCGGKPYYLSFYPVDGLRNGLRKLFLGNPAMNEFQRLQWLQRNRVPAPRAVASLMGFSINGRKGDAVLVEGLEPSIQLDKYLNQRELAAEDVPNHRDLVRQLLDLLEKLGRAGLGHSDLHLGNILLHDGKLHLLGASAIHKGGLLLKDILRLAVSAQPYATRTDLYRAWRQLGPGGPLPKRNRRAPSVWRQFIQGAFRNDRYFGHLTAGAWDGHFFKHAKFPRRWSSVSRVDITEKDWREAWPMLLAQIESDQFEILKRGSSGDVLAGEIVLGGHPISVVIKRSWRKYWHRYITDIGRGTRAHRAWVKSWELVVRNIPTAWPLLLMEKRTLGYVTDAIVVFERIPGHSLAEPVWAQVDREDYRRLLVRVGRLLRRLEHSGLYLYDAKCENWMIREDEKLGHIPMIIDVDGVRHIRQRSGGIRRLLRGLRQHRHVRFMWEDALSLARGYAPFAAVARLEKLCGVGPETPAHSAPPLPHRREEARG